MAETKNEFEKLDELNEPEDNVEEANLQSDSQSNVNLQAGDSLDEEFKSDEWLDLLDNKDILKKILFTKETNPECPTYPRANRDSRTKINLEVRNYATQQVISSECFSNLEVIVNNHDVIYGIDLILPMMHLYEKSRVLINPRFAYGEKGKLPDVEPNTRLDCTVEVLEINEDDLIELPIDEKISIAERKKIRGNFWFTREDYSAAIPCYQKCVELLESIDENELGEKATRLLVDCNNNLSLAQLRSDNLEQALKSVNKVLDLEPNNVKALFRKAQMLDLKNDDLELADKLLKSALELEPNNQAVGNLLIKLRKRRFIELDKEKKLYKKMISNQDETVDSTVDNRTDACNSTCASTVCENRKLQKKFGYILFAVSVVITLILAFIINQYLSNGHRY